MNATDLRTKFLAIEAKLALLQDDASLNARRYLKRAWGRALVIGQVAILFLLGYLVLRWERLSKEIS